MNATNDRSASAGRAHAAIPLGVALALTLGSIVASIANPANTSIARAQPNVVVVLMDTLRADALPEYGQELDTAPFLTRLAGESAVFEHAYSTSSWTPPAVASLFTSLYPFEHGVHRGFFFENTPVGAPSAGTIEMNSMPETVATMPELFQQAGYATVALSTNRNVESEIGFRRGFDRFEWHNDLPTDDVFALLRGWKRDLPDDRPHFVYIHLMDPHGPYVQHSPYRERFALHEDDRGFASYLSEVRFMDRHLSRIFRLFNDGNTLFVFVTDHGEEFHDHGNTLHGPYLYAELNRAAMMMYGPGLGVAPRRITENVSLVDVLPTLMDAIGSPMSERPSGTSLWPIVTGDSAAPAVLDELSRRLLFAHRSEPTPPYAESWAALRGPWKYIEHAGREPELYERDQDPAERNNLAQDEPDRVAPLARAIDSARSVSVIGQAGAVTVPMDDSLRETLEALGYAK